MTLLLVTIHDPEGRLLGIKNIESILKGALLNYESSIASITENTHPKMKEIARRHFKCMPQNVGTQGHHMMNLMKTAAGKNFHYCDFDRLIHWQRRYPEELRDVAKKLDKSDGFTFICRTKRAFETHPDTQKDTETVYNALVSDYLGMEVDIGSGTFGFDDKSRRAFASIKDDVSDARFLGCFLLCIKRGKIAISRVEAEGMEWETPDIYIKEIKKMGYKKWLAGFQTHDEWRRRVSYISQITGNLCKD